VVIYDVGESDGVYYITMELVNGKSLQSVLDSARNFRSPLLRIMEQICSALQFAHDHRVVASRTSSQPTFMLTGRRFCEDH